MFFQRYIGIDYSGRGTPQSRTSALQVFTSRPAEAPQQVAAPASSGKVKRNWCREELGGWLMEQLDSHPQVIVGIDHCLSFPYSYFQRYQQDGYDSFLSDFCRHWPTDREGVTIDSIRRPQAGVGAARTGSSKDLRVAETWSSSAKSVFQFDVQGSVAKSSHAGLPWLKRIRDQLGSRVHFWPFDGWEVPQGKSVIAECYPSILRNRYGRDERSVDEQDAYSIARWLMETDSHGFLDRYLMPPLTPQDAKIAKLEGWILGIC